MENPTLGQLFNRVNSVALACIKALDAYLKECDKVEIEIKKLADGQDEERFFMDFPEDHEIYTECNKAEKLYKALYDSLYTNNNEYLKAKGGFDVLVDDPTKKHALNKVSLKLAQKVLGLNLIN